jgi:hypothetical protein
MHDESEIVGVIRQRQAAMRREMDRRQIAMKVVSQDSGISYSTLLTYFPADPLKQPVQIPGSAIFALTGHLPADILSLLLPTGHVIVKASTTTRLRKPCTTSCKPRNVPTIPRARTVARSAPMRTTCFAASLLGWRHEQGLYLSRAVP